MQDAACVGGTTSCYSMCCRTTSVASQDNIPLHILPHYDLNLLLLLLQSAAGSLPPMNQPCLLMLTTAKQSRPAGVVASHHPNRRPQM